MSYEGLEPEEVVAKIRLEQEAEQAQREALRKKKATKPVVSARSRGEPAPGSIMERLQRIGQIAKTGEGIPGPALGPRPGSIGAKITSMKARAVDAYEGQFREAEFGIDKYRSKLMQEAEQAKLSGKDVEAGVKFAGATAVSAGAGFFKGSTAIIRPYNIVPGLAEVASIIKDPEKQKKLGESIKTDPMKTVAGLPGMYLGGVLSVKALQAGGRIAGKKIYDVRLKQYGKKHYDAIMSGEITGSDIPFKKGVKTGQVVPDEMLFAERELGLEFPTGKGEISETFRGFVKHRVKMTADAGKFDLAYYSKQADGPLSFKDASLIPDEAVSGASQVARGRKTGLFYDYRGDIGVVTTPSPLGGMKAFKEASKGLVARAEQVTMFAEKTAPTTPITTKPYLSLEKVMHVEPTYIATIKQIPGMRMSDVLSVSGLKAPSGLKTGVLSLTGVLSVGKTSEKLGKAHRARKTAKQVSSVKAMSALTDKLLESQRVGLRLVPKSIPDVIAVPDVAPIQVPALVPVLTTRTITRQRQRTRTVQELAFKTKPLTVSAPPPIALAPVEGPLRFDDRDRKKKKKRKPRKTGYLGELRLHTVREKPFITSKKKRKKKKKKRKKK